MNSKIILAALSCTVAAFVIAGCDWTSNGPSLNTSQGAGININFSGVYHGLISGRAVDRTSKGTIAWLTIRHSGNRIEVVDSQGSKYEGVVGAPAIVAAPRQDGFPAGAELVQAQVSFKGKDGVAQKDIEFVGIIHAVAVEDVKGDTRTTTDNSTRTDSSSRRHEIRTFISTNYVGQQEVTIRQYDPGTSNVISEVKYTIPPNGTLEEILQIYETQNQRTRGTESVTETTFQITEANVQYRLEGTWIEKNSPIVSRVDAISRGSFGLITISRRGSQEGGL